MDLNFRAGTYYIGSGPKKRCLPQMSSYRCNIRSTGFCFNVFIQFVYLFLSFQAVHFVTSFLIFLSLQLFFPVRLTLPFLSTRPFHCVILRPPFRCNSSLPFVTSFLSFQLFCIPFVTPSLPFQLFPSVSYTACLSLQLFSSVHYFLPIVSTLPSCSTKLNLFFRGESL